MTDNNQRPVEPAIVSDFSGKLSYSGYLSLAGLLAQQLTRGIPLLPATVRCNLRGARKAYRPTEVFFGQPSWEVTPTLQGKS
jgi:hypothetical protein